MGNFVYLKYTKLWKSVYLKYTKLHRWSLQADTHCSYGAVSPVVRHSGLYLRLLRSRSYACIVDCAAWRRRSQRASLIVTSVSTQATSENAAPTAPT